MAWLDLPTWQVVTMKWATVAVLICGVTYYYGGFDKIIAKYQSEPQAAVTNEVKEKSSKKRKAKNKPEGRVASGTDSGSAIDSHKTTSTKDMPAGSIPGARQSLVSSGGDVGDAGNKANREFAQSLTKAKLGTNFSSGKKNSANSRPRTVKSKLVDTTSSLESAATSSTGQDGDDETSRATSPMIKPATSEGVPDATGVSDMLEPESSNVRAASSEDVAHKRISGPAVRDTTGVQDMLEPANEALKTMKLVFQEVLPKKQKPAAKAPEPVETKKQRQQRRKREEEKERIAQSNKEHEAKRQQQMRGARMAEGTSNQSKADAFKPTVNAWTATSNESKADTVRQPFTGEISTAPLDTFEPKPAEGIVNQGAVTAQSLPQNSSEQNHASDVNGPKKELNGQKTAALATSERERVPEVHNTLQRTESWADQMDEEDQLKKAEEESREWESVITKKDKKKVRKADGETSGDSSRQVNGQVHQPTASIKTNGTASRLPPKPQTENRYGSLIADPTSTDVQEEAQDDVWEA
jgi:hypothetical protein